ncbi:hypothetical protein ACAG39_02010 [Caldicellulosiruptoraceae bacterium PP1]
MAVVSFIINNILAIILLAFALLVLIASITKKNIHWKLGKVEIIITVDEQKEKEGTLAQQ